jgi:hypothetical protein
MTDTKIVEITENGTEKRFVIRKLKATKSFAFLNNILNLLKDSDDFNAFAIKQFIYIAIEAGVNVPQATKESVNEVVNSFNNNSIALFYRIFKSITTTWTEEQQNKVLSQALQCVFFMQSANHPIELNMIEDNDHNIDLYVTDVATIYKLLWEVLEFNYSSFFSSHVMASS